MPSRILVVGLPRTLTTPFERFFIKRGDHKIYHEPVVRHVFSTKTDLVKSPYQPEATSSEILYQVCAENTEENFLIKEMAWAIHDSDFLDNLPSGMRVVLMLRRPEQAVLSHEKYFNINKELEKELKTDFTSFHTSEIVMDYRLIKNIYERLTKLGHSPILIDADDLATKPEAVIMNLCRELDIEFDPADLHWASGEATFWPYTKDTWQKDVTESTGFTPLRNAYSLSALSLADQVRLKPLIEANQAIYEDMVKLKLQLKL